MAAATPVVHESIRHWSFTAFEWVVRDVQKLCDFLESEASMARPDSEDETADSERDEFELLRESPNFGEGKFKLEIARTPHAEPVQGSSSHPQPTAALSLYVTCLSVDYHSDYELSTSMMAAVKCEDDRVGERGARADWAWDEWQSEWTFRRESEVWQCPLPPLSALLENPRIKQTDSFVICIQIHAPVGPFFPQHPTAYYVPRDLLEGLEASLDNQNTGDVRFICLERMQPGQQAQSPTTSHSASRSRRSSSSSSQPSYSSNATARKRVIYAHSDILTRRSEYFSTMLSSAFAETTPSGERKVYTVVVEEADFVTIYWLLKWIYANWLLFSENDDPRVAVEGVGAGWNARWLGASGMPGEWDWKTFSKNHPIDEPRDDIRSATSGESVHSVPDGQRSASKGKLTVPGDPSNSPARQRNPSSNSKPPQTTPTHVRTNTSTTLSRRSGVAPNLNVSVNNPQNLSSHVKVAPVPIPGAPPHYPLSPRNPRQGPSSSSAADPHAHPTATPSPASALSMYQIAHRYRMPGLASLALEHMLSTITPQSSFALLLASTVWDELHGLVEDYIVEKWEEVSISEEFEKCCDEVAAGEWGSDGGKTLMALFRRLRSPGIAYTRG
ncbi:hypothetical protein OF83DRAFT_1049301 [Amylostereum chailletii]|nr:hypothetical protein OF83DRAFT_1049301 [Amylostereum chailletii]